MTENELGSEIISAAMLLHSALGPGLLENTYRVCFTHGLKRKGLHVLEQVPIAIRYDGLIVENANRNANRIDILVDDRVVLELKSVDSILAVHRGQLLGYLRLGGFKLGYLLNFNVAHMRDGITRMANGL